MGKEKRDRNDKRFSSGKGSASLVGTVLVQAAVESTVVWGLQQQTFISHSCAA